MERTVLILVDPTFIKLHSITLRLQNIGAIPLSRTKGSFRTRYFYMLHFILFRLRNIGAHTNKSLTAPPNAMRYMGLRLNMGR